MKIELSRKDLVNLLRGTNPSYKAMENDIVKRCGRYVGGFEDSWKWNVDISSDISDIELYEAYLLCR